MVISDSYQNTRGPKVQVSNLSSDDSGSTYNYVFLLISVVCSNSFAQKPEIVVNSGHNDYILSLDISSDNKYVISGSMDNTIKLWEKESGRLIRTLYHGDGEVYLVFFIEDNSQIVSCGGNDTIRIWDLQSGELIKQFGYKVHIYNSVALSKDKTYIIAADEGDTVRVYNVATGQVEHTFSFPHSGDTVYVPSESGDELIEKIMPYYPEIEFLGISKNKNYLFAATSSAIYVWDVISDELINTFSDIGYLTYEYYEDPRVNEPDIKNIFNK